MSIVSGAAGSKLVLRSFKHLNTRPDTTWVNNYEFVTDAAWSFSDLVQCATNFQAYEQSFHSEHVIFDRWTFSTWAPDSTPYDPTSFMGGSWPVNTAGLVGDSTLVDIEPLDVVLWVQRQVATGRQGKLFFRGAMGEPFVTSPAGVPTLTGTTIATKHTLGREFILGHLVSQVSEEEDYPCKLALITANGSYRMVIDLIVKGVAINKRDRGYFDRI